MMKRFLFFVMMALWGVCAQAQRHYTFESRQLGPEWQYVGEPDASKYCFAEGNLRLKGSIFELKEERPATFVGLPCTKDTLQVNTKLTLFDTESGDEAGLCVFRSRRGYVQCCLNNYQGGHRLKLRLQLLSHRLLLVDRSVGNMTEVWLRVKSDGSKLKFFYSADGQRYQWLENVERRLLDSDVVGGGQLLVGMYAYMGSTKYNAGYTFGDFSFFDLQ